MNRILIIIFILSSFLYSQEEWYFQTPSGVNDVQFISNNTILAVGNGVWKSTDFGESWTGYPLGHTLIDESISYYPLSKIDIYSTTICYAVGNKGLMYKSNNGGTIWDRVYGPYDEYFTDYRDVAVLDINTAVVIGYAKLGDSNGGIIMRTTNGGENWDIIKEEAGAVYNDIKFVDNLNGWIACNNKIALKTTDGGVSWTTYNLPETLSSTLVGSLDFTDIDNGLITAGSANQIVKTTNGGTSWEVIETGFTGITESILLFTDGNAYMINETGQFLRSINSGSNWSEYSNLTASNYHLAFDNSLKGLAYNTNLMKYECNFTTNGGQDWEQYKWNPSSIYSFDQNNSWAKNVSDSSILRTTDGETWKSIRAKSDLNEVSDYGILQFLNTEEGYGMTSYKTSPTNYDIALIKTTDGGVNWVSIATGITLMDCYFVNSQFGWITTSDGEIFKTLDSTATWGEQESNTTSVISDISFADEENGWACGFAGIFLRTINGGLLWSIIDIPGYNDVDFYGVKFYGSLDGYMVGKKPNNDGVVLKTNNGGLNWVDITPPNLTNFLYASDFQVKSSTDIYMIQYDGLIIKSNDGGASYQYISYPGTNGDLSVVSDQRIYVVTKDGILYTKTGGNVTDVDENSVTQETPEAYTLYQNYPNPFNPSTKISYQIGSEGKVSLKIYNILGSEVATLINTNQNPGKYEVTFDASNLSSGLYFYRLSTNEYTSTKKMILLK